MIKSKQSQGFTLVELLVVISIIALLSTILYASFDQSRQQTRDKTRLSSLKELQLAIEQYKAQTGSYPLAGCGANPPQFAGPGVVSISGLRACEGNDIVNYISNLAPSYIKALPFDPKFEFESDRGFYYRSDGNSYKLMMRDVAENILIKSYDDEFARCPAKTSSGECSTNEPPSTTYAVYSIGAEDW